MKALEERASEMLQGASQGSSGASISEMLGHEMDRVQQALEHRFSRIETDIETLIQQVVIIALTMCKASCQTCLAFDGIHHHHHQHHWCCRLIVWQPRQYRALLHLKGMPLWISGPYALAAVNVMTEEKSTPACCIRLKPSSIQEKHLHERSMVMQEWKISAAADAAAERQIQARFGEQVRQFR